MKSKKEYLIKLLTWLQTSRPLAKGLLILIEQQQVDQKTIEIISDIMIRTVDTIVQKKHQEKVKKWIETLKKMQIKEKKEAKERKADEYLASKIDNL